LSVFYSLLYSKLNPNNSVKVYLKRRLLMSEMPKVGDKAPGFEAETYGGEKIKLSDYEGKSTVALYFYPKDNTPGCTKEACSMRDAMEELQKQSVQVLGVSTDGVNRTRASEINLILISLFLVIRAKKLLLPTV
jgi:peroxiredoxin